MRSGCSQTATHDNIVVIGVLKRIFTQPRYLVAAAVVFFVAFSAAILLPHYQLIGQVWSADVSLLSKFTFVLTLYGTIYSKHTIFSFTNLFVAISLFSLNVTLFVYYIRRRQEVSKGKTPHLAGLAGFVSSLLGIGCAACGSVIITSALSIFGASSLLFILPFRGAEFGALGILLLLVSIHYLIKRINDPFVCPLQDKELRTPSVDGA